MDWDTCRMTCIYCMASYRLVSPLWKSPVLHPFVDLRQPLAILLPPSYLSLPECSVTGDIQYVAFSDWLLSLRNVRLAVGRGEECAFHFPLFLPMAWKLISSSCRERFRCLDVPQIMDRDAANVPCRISCTYKGSPPLDKQGAQFLDCMAGSVVL